MKYVHHEALHYDIGIYFEANGHGTVLFKEHVMDHLRVLQSSSTLSPPQALSVHRLLMCHQLINQLWVMPSVMLSSWRLSCIYMGGD